MLSLTHRSIFLFLAVFVLTILFYRKQWLESWNAQIPIFVVSTVKPDEVKPIHQQPSKEAVELDFLKNLTAWPSTPPLLLNFSWNDTSDPRHNTFTVLPKRGGGQWHVGDELEVLIKMYNFQGKPKKSGGDFLLARLHSPSLQAGVAGKVVDHLNGSYSAVFPLLWEGNVQVQVILVHSSEAVTVLQQLNRMQPHRIYFQSLFRSASLTETTTCNVYINATQQQLGNYTDLHTGEQWFCYKPKKLSCDARVTHTMGGFRKNIKRQEEMLFQRKVCLMDENKPNKRIRTQSRPKDFSSLNTPQVFLGCGSSGAENNRKDPSRR